MTTETEPIEAEVISNGRAMAVSETVALPVSVEVALQQWHDYQELTRKLLDESDYQKAPGGKRFKKKSAWRKYARAFNLTDDVSHEEVARDEDGWPLWARLRVKVTAPNGRVTEADHECHRSERCCPARTGAYCRKADWDSHTCCSEGCDGREHWAHPGDIVATALTRAKNRAISDMIGAGEVSAEEMDGQREAHEEREYRPQGVRQPPPKAQVAAARQRVAETIHITERDGVDRPPECPQHGNSMKFVAAGTSKKTGKDYSSFWTCESRDCTKGSQGKAYYVDAGNWFNVHRADTAGPAISYDPDELPNE